MALFDNVINKPLGFSKGINVKADYTSGFRYGDFVIPSRFESKASNYAEVFSVGLEGSVRIDFLKARENVLNNYYDFADQPGHRSVKFTSSQMIGKDDVEQKTQGADALYEGCIQEFLNLARAETLEYGVYSGCDKLVASWIKLYRDKVGGLIQSIYIKNCNNVSVLLALIKAISSVGYGKTYPYGQMIAIAALANSDCEIKEAGIRAFEQWGTKEGISVLKSHEIKDAWLDQYRLETIKFLEEL